MKTSQPQTAEVIAAPPLLYLASLALGFATNTLLPQPVAIPSLAPHVAGAMLLLSSGAFARWAFVAMKRQDTSANPRKESNALTTDGPFKISRNPIYVAMTGLYFGVSLLGNSLWPFIFSVPLLATMHYGVVLREERYLNQRFGKAYAAYKSGTRRWL